eukprot:TsM_000806800 transcript=TsM_000806800 gene=TsM_000806800
MGPTAAAMPLIMLELPIAMVSLERPRKRTKRRVCSGQGTATKEECTFKHTYYFRNNKFIFVTLFKGIECD